MHSLWRTHKILIIVLMIVAPMLLAIVIYRQSVSTPRLAVLEKTYYQRQVAVRQERAGRAREQGPVAEFKRNLGDLRVFEQRLPPERELSALIGELYELADNAGFDIAAVTYQTEELVETDILAYSLQFSLQGAYPRVKRFLHSLEQSRRLITIDSLGLSGAEDGAGALRLKLTTYFSAEGP